MSGLFFGVLVATFGILHALQVPPRENAVKWFEIQPAHKINEIPQQQQELKPLLGGADGHEMTSTNREYLSAWSEFKAKFKRVYKDFEEELTRFTIFVKNMIFVLEHNKLYREGKSSYEVGINEYADMSNEEFVAKRNGLRMSRKSSKKMLTYKPMVDVTDLPASVDWRTKGYVTPIKNQGHCGSCWSFSATGALEGQWFAKKGKLVSLSEQQLVDCSQNWGDEGCNGGLMDNAFTYVKAIGGLESEGDYPYTGSDGKCKFNKSAVVAQDTGFVDVAQGDENALQQALATVGPVSVAIDASQMSFQMYKQGIYDEPSCSSTQLDHGVLAVGYDTDAKTSKAFWIVKNSWGTGWGEQGYIRMARNEKNRCGIATAASYPTV